MICYLVRTEDRAIRWAPSLSVARRFVCQFKSLYSGHDFYFEQHDIPTKKEQLLDWLNQWMREDHDE